jgi:hypothetical protein
VRWVAYDLVGSPVGGVYWQGWCPSWYAEDFGGPKGLLVAMLVDSRRRPGPVLSLR